MQNLPRHAGTLLMRIRENAPRVHCLTNAVVKELTADGLTAIGAIPSMTENADEMPDFMDVSKALLVNLGTLDPARTEAIKTAVSLMAAAQKPFIIDPVKVEISESRLALAHTLCAQRPAAIRGNAAEIAALAPSAPSAALVTTGADDTIRWGGKSITVHNGDPLMGYVTGTGCLSGGVIAAFLTVEEDRMIAAACAMLVMGVAAEIARPQARGPGTFRAALLDALYSLDTETLIQHGRISQNG
ncbi:hydroxyethylthiazole kinase [Limoniibacter endophyticus]|uniref:Hydroxyethylthiazole kinase n=1 Tax=Limoniibacter endophyticus TaxID=1565040 RepID=A0A8J3DND5_9HYPH|nr:hydroxyethylthiazole kinase [Limoniibacter endophyticus]GHC67551.1 putative hydroxyethylthiazole kinase [Limoniibacter endophyticus]